MIHNHSKFKKSIIRFFSLVAFVGFVWFLSYYFKINQETLQGLLSRYPARFQWFIFIFLYTVVTFFIWVIKDPLKIIGAVLFGPYISSFLIWIAETINCFVMFYSSRYLVRGIFDKFLRGRAQDVDDRIAKANFLWLFLLRFVPLVPYRILDVTAGATRIDFRRYLLVVLFASPLRILWIQYILASIGEGIFKDPLSMVTYFLTNKPMMILSLIYSLFVIAVVLKFRNK